MAFGKFSSGELDWKKGGVLTASDLNQIAKVIPPIGGIIPWLKTLTGVPQTLPAGYAECDGSAISDGDSPLDGETLPDLNGNNNFLRGETTSGGTGGASTHTHGVTAGGVYAHSGSMPHTTDSHEPTYYDVVYIMRIK